MIKSALRQHFLAQRRALSQNEAGRRGLAIAGQFVKTFLTDTGEIKSVHTFLPIVGQGEIDTWPIIHHIWQNVPNVQVAVPVADVITNYLTHHLLTPETPLVESRWGIPEPQPGSSLKITPQQIDVVLVPLLAFDRRGHRVGYGRGYYDRFLNECRPDCLKIGLSLFEPVEQIADIESTDVQLTACITPEQVYFF